MFEHSVKVPRNFKIAANIVKKVSTEGGSVKTLLYDDKLRHFRTNVLYALINETIKHAAEIDKIFESCGLLANEARLDPWLAKVLTAELLFGKKELPGNSKPVQTILSYKDQFEKLTANREDSNKTEAIRRPRYVRVNTNLLTTSDAIGAFQEEGYRFIRCTSGSYNDYLAQIQKLTEYDFTQDYHVKTMFVFPAGTKLHEHDLYLENKIVLQDKATALAVHLLAPPPGSVALDMCAAPGMKTTQLAAFMRNQGKIYAVERNEKRYQTLCDIVEKTGSKCVETIHKDCLEIKRGDYDDVEYIILDPSCSGSGMELCVHNYIEESRLAKLTSLQEKFLKHAMNAFPKAKRIVYSTCSIFPEENERVITNVVKASRAKWKVQDVKELLKGQWNNFGSSMYGSMGARCMYARPESDFTIGFFLAVLDRDPTDAGKNKIKDGNVNNKEVYNETNDNEEFGENNYTLNDKKRKKRKIDNTGEEIVTETVSVEVKKKKKKRDIEPIAETIENETALNETPVENRKKKKKKKHDENVVTDTDIPEIIKENKISESEYVSNSTEFETVGEVTKKKNKHKHVTEQIDNIDEIPDNIEANDESFEQPPRKKKYKKSKNFDDNEIVDSIEEIKSSKKKKKKHKNTEEIDY